MSLQQAFYESFLSETPRSYVASLDKGAFERRVKALWEFFKERSEEVKVSLWEDGSSLFILVNMDDQPFIIDTAELVLKRKGVPAKAVVHPILPVKRDESGRVVAIGEGKRESVALIELLPGLDREKVEEALQDLKSILAMVKAMVEDFYRMKRKMRDAINDIEFLEELGKLEKEEAEEAAKFLEWVLDNNYVFSAYAEFNGGPSSCMGILREKFKDRYLLELSEIEEVLSEDKNLILVGKLSQDSWIHRPGKMDIIATRMTDEEGNYTGWRVWVGLWAKKAVSTKGADVPLLRKKLTELLAKRGVVFGSHNYKRIVEIFNSIPIEELFVATVDDIAEVVDAILGMGLEPRTEVLIRERSKGITSVLVILPESRFSINAAEEIKSYLMERFSSDYADMRFSIYEHAFAMLYFFLTPKRKVEVAEKQLKEEISRITAEWEDLFREELKKRFPKRWENLYFKYTGAFPNEYKASVSARGAVEDVASLEELSPDGPFKVVVDEEEDFSVIKIYSLFEWKLSDAVPVLEHFYLTIWDEKPYKLSLASGGEVFIHSYRVLTKSGEKIPKEARKRLSEAISAVIDRKVESDPLNNLVLIAGFDWKAVDMLRTYRNYIRQIVPSIAYSTAYSAFRNYPHLTRLLWEFFDTKFNPELKLSLEERTEKLSEIKESFFSSLTEVSSLAEDKVFRTYFNAIESTIRTNFYRRDKKSHYISIKIDCSKILEMPLPRPMYEVYVHQFGMEGVHLRGGKVARGGIRWSDRPDDFRTEILGLMKTQMVKNSIIVPTGAKGGFIVKLRYYQVKDRKQLEELVKEKYTFLMRGLLDVTDNIVDGRVVPPPDVVRYDGDDPYLVVAADKGTAKLSDVANAIAKEYGFWLDDAFASGGSTGYDHKKLGVTAKGAWVCVRRHFMEMGIHPERDVITAVGIGDMSGDVFGNGLLLSRTVKLIAAFNHRVIFLDPDPDPETSYQERLRLFKEVKDWDHYNPELISKGGGVFRRDAKSIKLSPEARKALGTDKEEVSGEELIKIILKAPVDLLWNGGIGTYVKASWESNAEVGDPPNDNVRVNANELRVKVVGEGGNLGFTQKARVEYAALGGRINMDAVDNSGGVDTSDHEVNLKILLSTPIKEGKLTYQERNKLIFDIADEVLKNVLRNNYTQSLSISLDTIRSKRDLSPFIYTIDTLIEDGFIDTREIYLPDKKELAKRAEEGVGLLKPELALLIGLQKRWSKEKLKDSSLLKAEYLEDFLYNYFPDTIREKFAEYIPKHPLRNEIVLTCTVNAIVDHAGVSFYHKIYKDHGAQVEETTASYIMMDGVLGASSLRNRIFELDFKVPASAQYQALLDIQDTIEELVKWSHFFIGDWLPLTVVVEKYRKEVERLKGSLPAILSSREKEELLARVNRFREAGFPEDLARDIATVPFLANAMDIITLSEVLEMDPVLLAGIYHTISNKFMIQDVEEAIVSESKHTDWDHLAYSMLHRELYFVRRKLVQRFVQFMRTKEKDVDLFMSKEIRNWETVSQLIKEALEQKAKGAAVWYVIINRMKEVVV